MWALFDVEMYVYTSTGATKVNTYRFVIHTNTSKRTNEIKEHRHEYTQSVVPFFFLLMINGFVGVVLYLIDLVTREEKKTSSKRRYSITQTDINKIV